MTTLYQRFENNPKEALEELFRLDGDKYSYMGTGPTLFLWQGGRDCDGTRYGSYQHVSQKGLGNRKYAVEWVDYRPSICYTDVVYNPRTSKYEDHNV
jgi:hypothetical protein